MNVTCLRCAAMAMSQQCCCAPFFRLAQVVVSACAQSQHFTRVVCVFVENVLLEISQYKADFSYNHMMTHIYIYMRTTKTTTIKNVTDFDACHFILIFILIFFYGRIVIILNEKYTLWSMQQTSELTVKLNLMVTNNPPYFFFHFNILNENTVATITDLSQ